MVFMGRWGARARVARPARHSLTGKVPVQRARAPRTVSSSSEIKSEAGGQGATIAVGNEEEPHPPPARSSGARPKERRRGAGPPSWRASTPPEKLQNLAQEDRGSAAPVVIFGDAALSCNAIGFPDRVRMHLPFPGRLWAHNRCTRPPDVAREAEDPIPGPGWAWPRSVYMLVLFARPGRVRGASQRHRDGYKTPSRPQKIAAPKRQGSVGTVERASRARGSPANLEGDGGSRSHTPAS
ncbi:unnamed protein product [Prorocentrum cordatum]|uniref:Uncharacterized protein n=1 Tax=Prorocentrum cordatum TaxID=2364126 RepID=A0ABN9U2H8_9DINO|nr:unnamed protein product [Polarella glacialis]